MWETSLGTSSRVQGAEMLASLLKHGSADLNGAGVRAWQLSCWVPTLLPGLFWPTPTNTLHDHSWSQQRGQAMPESIPWRLHLQVSYKQDMQHISSNLMLQNTIPAVWNMGLVLSWKFWIQKPILNTLKIVIAPAAAWEVHKTHRRCMPKRFFLQM